jgi:hypothetical protein
MPSSFDESEFIDTDFQARKLAAAPTAAALSAGSGSGGGLASRPPSREELEAQVSTVHTRLAELKRLQEALERERAALEEGRRRRVELQTGREEMLQHLVRGIGLLEEAEFAARQEAEQLAKTLAGLREALAHVQAIREDTWTQENWTTELTRALTTIENARMEWNSARLKWPLLNGAAAPAAEAQKQSTAPAAAFPPRGFLANCQLGLALTWPVVLLGAVALVVWLLGR